MAWYEEQGPSAEDVRDEIQTFFEDKKYDMVEIQKCTDRIVPMTRNDFGSYRGYQSSRMKEKLIKIITHLYARNKIAAFIEPWVQDILYRPPTENQAAGLRYKGVEEHFNSISNVNRPT